MLCPNYLYIKNQYIRDLNSLKESFKAANKDTSSPIYVGIVDSIMDNTLVKWIEDKVDDKTKSQIEVICKNVQCKTFTRDDGIKLLSEKLFNLNTERDLNKYLIFDINSLKISATGDNLTEIDNRYIYKRDDSKVSISYSVDYNILESLDYWFSFGIRVIDTQKNEEIEVNFKQEYINTKNLLQNSHADRGLKFNIEGDLAEGQYRVELFCSNSKERSALLSRILEVKYFDIKDCIEVRSVEIPLKHIYKHRNLADTFIFIEGDPQKMHVIIDAKVSRYISKYNVIVKLIDNDEHVVSSKIYGLNKYNFESPLDVPLKVDNLTTNIYYLVIECEGVILHDRFAFYVTGGKREYEFRNGIKINFREIVDKDHHYLIEETVVTEEIYNGIMQGIHGDKMPHLFHKTANITIDNFHTEIKGFCKQCICKGSGRSFEYMDPTLWKHILNSGNITIHEDIVNLGWFSDSNGANGIIHCVAEKKPNILGLYDIVGNVDTIVLYKEGGYFSNSKMCIVGGNFAQDSTDSIEKYIVDEDSSELAIRLSCILPSIQNKNINY